MRILIVQILKGLKVGSENERERVSGGFIYAVSRRDVVTRLSSGWFLFWYQSCSVKFWQHLVNYVIYLLK